MFSAGNATEPGHWGVQVFRLASAVDSLKFKFVPGTVYYFQAGHRYWATAKTTTPQGNQSD
jgi:hypothetical protein